MTLPTGSRLGPYEVLAPLGTGGMGEVYRVRDSKLGRDVALKVLPEEFFEDADRVARFEREAKSLAALPPRVLFADRFERPQAGGHVSYDVAKDGRFLMIAAPEGRASHQSEIHVVLNWFEELRRLAKAGK